MMENKWVKIYYILYYIFWVTVLIYYLKQKLKHIQNQFIIIGNIKCSLVFQRKLNASKIAYLSNIAKATTTISYF